MTNNTKNITKYILIGITILALILAVTNLLSLNKVTATMSYGSNKASESLSMGDLKKLMGDSAIPSTLGNIAFGIFSLVVAATGIMHYNKQDNGGKRYVFRMGVLGAVGAVLQIVMYTLCTSSGMGMKLTISPNWTTYFALVVFVGCAVADKFYLRKMN